MEYASFLPASSSSLNLRGQVPHDHFQDWQSSLHFSPASLTKKFIDNLPPHSSSLNHPSSLIQLMRRPRRDNTMISIQFPDSSSVISSSDAEGIPVSYDLSSSSSSLYANSASLPLTVSSSLSSCSFPEVIDSFY